MIKSLIDESAADEWQTIWQMLYVLFYYFIVCLWATEVKWSFTFICLVFIFKNHKFYFNLFWNTNNSLKWSISLKIDVTLKFVYEMVCYAANRISLSVKPFENKLRAKKKRPFLWTFSSVVCMWVIYTNFLLQFWSSNF